MDGLLIVDKPSGPTSHDVVARVRRALRERRIGHTGTLDPMASGVLPLVVGRATRLARFLSGDKAYDAVIRLGINTDTCDRLGTPVGEPFVGSWPDRAAIDTALDRFRGTFLQQPPAFSAKKIAGQRSYDLARRAARASAGTSSAVESAALTLPAPASVTTYAVELVEVVGDRVRLHVRCSAGFYIRSLASDLGAALGTGAHLVDLRRTAACGASLDDAVSLEVLEGADGASAVQASLIPMSRMLESIPAVALTDDGVMHVRFGRNLGPSDASSGFVEAVDQASGPARLHVRLLDRAGQLVALAEAADAPGLLHPAVVLM